jgi:tetratricopeptide (TPR) repeat protein
VRLVAALLRAGEPGRARPHATRALESFRALALLSPDAPDARMGVAESLGMLAGIESDEGDAERALALFDEALTLREALVAAHPDAVGLREGLCAALHNRADLLEGLGRLPEARRGRERAVEVATGFGDLARLPAPMLYNVVWLHLALARMQLDAGERQPALERLDHVAAQGFPAADVWYELARGYCRAALDPELSTQDGRGAREATLDALRRAVELGWNEPAALDGDPSWAALKGSEQLEELLAPLRDR